MQYFIQVSKRANRDGRKLLEKNQRSAVIRKLKKLVDWPDIQKEFEIEKVWGEEFHEVKISDPLLKDIWLRVHIYVDDDNGVIHILNGYKKKSNVIQDIDKLPARREVRRIKLSQNIQLE
ncbi:MAG: hypothetical protein OEZ36_09240 [Spirochaetota bacterium]|nr:hypothetical protein [Spirochaetota bacterium]